MPKYVIYRWFPTRKKEQRLWESSFESVDDANAWLAEKKVDHPSLSDFLVLLPDEKP